MSVEPFGNCTRQAIPYNRDELCSVYVDKTVEFQRFHGIFAASFGRLLFFIK